VEQIEVKKVKCDNKRLEGKTHQSENFFGVNDSSFFVTKERIDDTLKNPHTIRGQEEDKEEDKDKDKEKNKKKKKK
jgi:hypothetical protein